MQEADRERSLLAEEHWRSQLEHIELTLSEVSKAIGALRDTLERGEAGTPAPLPVHAARSEEEADTQGREAERAPEAPGALEQTADSAEEAEDDSTPPDFQNVWQRLQRVRKERSPDGADEPPELPVDDAEARADGSIDDDGTPSEAISTDKQIIDPGDGEEDGPPPADFQNVWQRLQRERAARSAKGAGSLPELVVDVEGAGADGRTDDGADRAQGDSRVGNFQNVWERLQREREERSAAPLEDVADVRGLGNLPQSYRITIEDRDGTPVDLVPVHRALLAFASADDVSLVNFANGTAIISLRTTEKLDLDELSSVISAATSRECEVIEQDQGKLFLRLSVEEEAEQDRDG